MKEMSGTKKDKFVFFFNYQTTWVIDIMKFLLLLLLLFPHCGLKTQGISKNGHIIIYFFVLGHMII